MSKDATAKPLSAEEALRKKAFDPLLGHWFGSSEMQSVFRLLDASRAETAALKERRREAVSEIVSSYEAHGDTGLRLEAVEALAADLVEGLDALRLVAAEAWNAISRDVPGLAGEIIAAQTLITRAAALGVGKQEGEKEKGNG